MSSFAAGYLSSVREGSPEGKSTDEKPPGVKTFIDALAALVPAEVLVAHSVILAKATELTTSADGKATTVIIEPRALEVTFWALSVVAALVYVTGRIVGARSKGQRVKWDRWDLARALIPAFAFVGWTMLQSPTAFDALGIQWSAALRTAIAIVGGMVLGSLASLFIPRVSSQCRRSLRRLATHRADRRRQGWTAYFATQERRRW